MTADFDELRSRIAAQHQVLVGPDDPILMLITANDFCLQRSLQMLESAHARALTLQNQQLEHAAKIWLSAAEGATRETLERAGNAIAVAATSAAASAKATIAESTATSVTALRFALALTLCSSLLSLLACVLLWLR